jgi:hypothetical protein
VAVETPQLSFSQICVNVFVLLFVAGKLPIRVTHGLGEISVHIGVTIT